MTSLLDSQSIGLLSKRFSNFDQVTVIENFKSNLDVIEDLSYAQIKQMVLDREYVLIYACKFKIEFKKVV